ncbi:MAG TPA: PAS domain S-box protein [Rectinemataceae bacterium]|nr:PAS domain S-box protein [Rectinemataceae bacterium]
MENEEPTAVENLLFKSQIAALEQLLEVYEKSVLEKTDELYAEIAKRKQMEEALRQSEERYRTIIDEMEEWYFETDLEGYFTFFNDIFARALVLSREELIGKNYQDFIKKEDSVSVAKLFNQIFKTGNSTRNFSYEFTRRNGAIAYIEFSFFPKRDEKARIVGFRGVGHDITERKHAEDRIQ